MGNLILFPAQSSTYTPDTPDVRDRLVWVPDPTGRRFPCLWYECNSPHTLLYFHGNSVDLGDIADELFFLHHHIQCNILAIEFPGYGICADISVDSRIIDIWGKSAFDWLVNLGANPMSIVSFGRSIGTGPAAKLAATLKQGNIGLGGVVLHCPYLSVHKVVADYTTLGTWVIGNYWDTEESLRKIAPTTPLLIIHGQNDETIPVYHGQKLLEQYTGDPSIKEGFFPEDSPHNAYMVVDDLGIPIKKFVESKSLSRYSRPLAVKIPARDRELPSAYVKWCRSEMKPTPISRGASTLLDLTTKRASLIQDTASGEALSSIRSLAELSEVPTLEPSLRHREVSRTEDDVVCRGSKKSSIHTKHTGSSQGLSSVSPLQSQNSHLLCPCCPKSSAPEDSLEFLS